MRLSTRGRYAVMAMVELAARAGGGGADKPCTLSDIATAQGLSLAYLEQLFLRLRRTGLVTAARGPGGGYRLARPAAEITLAAIVDGVDEPLHATRCEEGQGCLEGERCLTHDLWCELGDQIRLFLGHLTLDDVVAGQIRGRAHPPHARSLRQAE
mgnify:CR=1 FL=1